MIFEVIYDSQVENFYETEKYLELVGSNLSPLHKNSNSEK